jgi:quercetin dioxygenase-like cupin family protein
MNNLDDDVVPGERVVGRSTQTTSPDFAQVTYHRIYADANGDSHFDTVTVEQRLARGAPPAAPFYVSEDRPASKYRFYSFEPGWIGELHPAPTRQLLACMSGTVEMETTDGTVRRLEPGDLVLLEDTSRKGHVTRNIGDGYATFLAVPVPAA